MEDTPQYPDTKKLVILKGKGTPSETRIETNITVYLLKNGNEPALDREGRPIYFTIPTDED